MLSKEVTDKDGTKKMVYASTEEALNEAVKAVEDQSKPTYPNINHPVAKGHDLVETQEDMSTKLVDGTGAHNSPNNAVEPFSPETDSDQPVLGMDEPAEKVQGDPGNIRDRAEDAEENRKKTDTPDTNVRGKMNK